VTNRSCPACERPTVSPWRLLWLGGARRIACTHCGAKIGVSPLSYFVVLAFGTWLPVAGAILGATVAEGVIGNSFLIGGAVGLIVTSIIFTALYFRGAKLVVS
jgi:hypothetical protein